MSFIGDKKREHEAAAETALKEKDYSKAFFHTGKAAEFGFTLAERTEGKVAERYVEDANELIEIAASLKEKARSQPKTPPRTVTAGASDDTKEEPSAWQLTEKPDIRLDDVAGLDDVKEALREDVIDVFKHAEIYERFREEGGGGVLMYGPPGNGKTFIAKAIAGELDAAFFPIDAAQIKDKYVGETEKNLKRLFDEAQKHERAVIFLDEVDALLGKRGNRKVNAVTQFLTLADGIVKTKNCMLLLGATNKPWSIDEAALRPGRFGRQIHVGLPDETAREAIVRYCLREVPVESEFPYGDIAGSTDGFSGADMADVCRRAKKLAIRRQIESGNEEVVCLADFQAALRKVQPSVTEELLAEFATWRDSRQHQGDDTDDA